MMLNKPIRLDIGAGQPGWQKLPLDEWTHLDIMPWEHIELVVDYAAIPLEPASVDEIWAGDVIEHVPVWRHAEVFSEWNRVLKPGGLIAGTTPNPGHAMRAYLDQRLSYEDMIGALYGKGNRPTEVHYCTYGKEMLVDLLGRYGFDVQDFSESPGPPDCPWWWRFKGHKRRDV